VRVRGSTPTPLSTSTITYKVAVYAPAERAETLPLFLLYPYMYSVVCTGELAKVASRNVLKSKKINYLGAVLMSSGKVFFINNSLVYFFYAICKRVLYLDCRVQNKPLCLNCMIMRA
jgi:hypothetical protein